MQLYAERWHKSGLLGPHEYHAYTVNVCAICGFWVFLEGDGESVVHVDVGRDVLCFDADGLK